MENTEAEGLYPQYRQETTNKLVTLMQKGQVFRLTAPSGSGKSKYLRYIANSKTIYEKYFASFLEKIFYIDLNEIYKLDTESLVKVISKTINANGNKLDEKIGELTKNKKLVYIIFDHFEKTNNFDADTICRYLRSLRDKYKYKLGYILSYEKEIQMDEQKLRYLWVVSPVEINLPPLSKEDSLHVLVDELERNNLELPKSEKEKIVDFCNGKGGKIRDIVLQISHGLNLNQILQIKTNVTNNSNIDVTLFQKILTKYEYLIFIKLSKITGAIISRDEIAEILSPASNGAGVSNEAIDQIITRLRKKLKENGINYRIINKHGIGYYLE